MQAWAWANLSRCHREEMMDSQQVMGPPADTSHTWPDSLAFCLAALSIASPFDSIYLGLHNYNCALACIATGGMFYALTWQTHLLSLACGMYLLHKGKTKIDAARQTMGSTGFESNTTLLQNWVLHKSYFCDGIRAELGYASCKCKEKGLKTSGKGGSTVCERSTSCAMSRFNKLATQQIHRSRFFTTICIIRGSVS